MIQDPGYKILKAQQPQPMEDLMKRTFFLVITLIFGVLTLHPTIAGAQTATMKLTGAGPTNDGHFYTGPYQGTMNGASVTLNCADFFHQVTLGEVWQANISSLTGDLSNTRLGNAGRQAYQKMALLTSVIDTTTDPSAVTAQSHAIWMLNPDSTLSAYPSFMQADYLNNTGPNSAGYWIAFANTHYNTVDPSFYGGFQLATDVNKNNLGSAQEFITTPEPGSLALLSTGLIGFAPLMRRKRR